MRGPFKLNWRRKKRHWLAIFFYFLVWDAAGSDRPLNVPLAIANHNPFIRIYGIPYTLAPFVKGQGYDLDLQLDVSSSFTDANTGEEFIVMDGETYRLTLRGVYGWNNGWESGVEVPFIKHSGGFLDSFILNWHDLFSFPQLGRDKVANNQLHYRYRRDGVDLVNVSDGTSGLGDIVLYAAREVPFGEQTAARVQIKLPTGSSDKLFGSGGVDIALSLQSAFELHNNWRLFGGAGGAYLGPGEVLPSLQRHWAAFANLGLIWQAAPRVSLQLQFAGQTSVYNDSALHQLDSGAVQTTLGGTIKLANNWYLDLGVTEDEIVFDVSPDVSFHLRLRHSN